MSGTPKVKVTFEIYQDSFEMLMKAGQDYKIEEISKVLRCLLDYAATDGNWDEIFGKIRCRRCG